jgi:predicted phosphodiesterase
LTTLVVSDLHLGASTAADVLRHRVARDRLLERLAGVDRLVLLGDLLELRHGPAREAMAVARPVLQEIGAALAPGTPVVIVPGNHDHGLVDPWLVGRGRRTAPAPLGLAEEVTPRQASPLAMAVDRALGDVEVTLAYPGFWIRDDVWATHGHYLDVHGTLPTFERLAAGLMAKLVGVVPEPRATPDDYEAILAPIYAWIDAAAERAAPGRAAAGSGSAVQAYQLLSGGGRRPIAARAIAGLFPLAILGINRLGLGPVRADLRGDELRRSALRGMAEAVVRLDVPARHVIFGHSHRAGPLPGDDAGEWRVPAGAQLHNGGCWMYETHFLGGADPRSSPYWPGGVTVVDDDGPPRLERLLDGVPAAELRGNE